jgi:redox-sensitive bicupin YhaK (pirin superfamily)
MSFMPVHDPEPGNAAQAEAVAHVIVPRSVDLGDFVVRRALPSVEARMVGPFVFFDHMGPAVFKSRAGVDVRPHPHIGLATLTYLFDGEIVHRDSLGTAVAIRPGEVNLMTAGRGIVHSERTAPERKASGGNLHGLQCWLGLPAAQEETDPAFAHYGAGEFPVVRDSDKAVRVVAGSLYGTRSPVVTASETLFADATLRPGAVLPVDAHYEERSVYVVDGEIEIGGDRFGPGQLLVLRPGDNVTVKAVQDSQKDAHIVIAGGAAMDGPRHLWWNFVSSRKERIEQAKAEWAAGRFAKVPGDDIEFIPLPEK